MAPSWSAPARSRSGVLLRVAAGLDPHRRSASQRAAAITPGNEEKRSSGDADGPGASRPGANGLGPTSWGHRTSLLMGDGVHIIRLTNSLKSIACRQRVIHRTKLVRSRSTQRRADVGSRTRRAGEPCRGRRADRGPPAARSGGGIGPGRRGLPGEHRARGGHPLDDLPARRRGGARRFPSLRAHVQPGRVLSDAGHFWSLTDVWPRL